MSRRLGPSGMFWLAVVFFRVFRGALLVTSAALVAFLLLLLGSRVVRKRSFTISGSGGRGDIGGTWRADIGGGNGGSRRVDIGNTRRADTRNARRANAGGGNDSDSNSKSYDPSLVVDARYEEIE